MSIPNHAGALPGTWNFRDIGGVPTPDGPIRRGVVFRSAVLSRLDPAGVRALESLGVTEVFDLRGPLEIAKDGTDRLPESVTVTVAPFHPEGDEPPVHEAPKGAAPPTPIDRVRSYYAAMPILGPAQQSIAALLRTVADGSGGVLVHCAAGKDRTGWAIATLLTISGADRDAVLADYLLSNTAIESLRVWIQEQYGDAFLADGGILGVDESYLQAAFESADRSFGSFAGYLDAIGIDKEVTGRIRRRLVG
ncbi:MAG TPA: tyrosine-protein phosphatase [Nakamurella sp.]